MKYLRKKDSGWQVKILQQTLGINDDGVFGDETEQAVIQTQIEHNITVDGIVGEQTWQAIGIDTSQYGLFSKNTDDQLAYRGTLYISDYLQIERRFLDTDQYVKERGFMEPYSVFIHHTAGWDNPVQTANDWNTDSRGRVGTHYIIGGTSINNPNNPYNGRVLQCIPDNFAAYHLGRIPAMDVNLHSVGVELCNFGFLYEKNNKFYAWPAKNATGDWVEDYARYEVRKEVVCDLRKPWRGHQFWHAYSRIQIRRLYYLLKYIERVHYNTIQLYNGIPQMLKLNVEPFDVFDYNSRAAYGKIDGVWSHSNVRKDKTDVCPQPDLLRMLKSL